MQKIEMYGWEWLRKGNVRFYKIHLKEEKKQPDKAEAIVDVLTLLLKLFSNWAHHFCYLIIIPLLMK